MDKVKILIVEDERIIAEDIKKRLEKFGYEIKGIEATGSKAIQAVEEKSPDLVLMDIVLKGDMDGIEATRIIQENIHIPVIYLTAYSDEEILNRATKTESYGYLVKPFKDRELHATIKMAIAKYKLEKEVKEARDWFYSILKCIGDGVIATDDAGSVTFLNKVASELTGWKQKEALGKSIQSIFNLSNITSTKDDIFSGHQASPAISEYSIPTRQGEKKHLSGVLLTREKATVEVEDSFAAIHTDNGENSGSVIVFRDITERKKAEKEQEKIESQLRQSQKIASIGTLAGGIAHDFNNILSGIIGYSELIQREVSVDSTVGRDIVEVIGAGKRAAELVKQILTFSRKTERSRLPLHPHLVIKEALKLLRATLPTTVHIEENIAPDCGTILADPTNIHQLIVNLCTNALHAMAGEKGTLSVSLERQELSAGEVNGEIGVAPGPFVVLMVSDTGCGMEQSIVDRIFEPYFTTKEIGAGTGLGLSVSHGIVRNAHGFIKVQSAPGAGSTFTVYLPALQKKNGAMDELAYTSPQQRGHEHILVVDDEAFLVRVTQRQLENLGYRVTGTTDSKDALEKIRTDPDGFDLLITDQTMPGLTGEELVMAVKEIKPEMPIILCTGHSSVLSREKSEAIGVDRYIDKPIIGGKLSDVVRELLDEK